MPNDAVDAQAFRGLVNLLSNAPIRGETQEQMKARLAVEGVSPQAFDRMADITKLLPKNRTEMDKTLEQTGKTHNG